MKDIRQFLELRLGLEPDSFGKNSYLPHVREIMRKLGLETEEELLGRLAHDPGCFDEFVNRILINESWFFRDSETFEALAEQLRSRPAGRPTFRILSLPCAAGEEAYSIAIRLEQEQLSNYWIDALDLSEAALARARRGQYGQYAFRGVDPRVRDLHFTQLSAQKWEINLPLRQRIDFMRANVAEPGFLPEHKKYDAILCRNLLIYLTREARLRLMRALQEALAPEGELYLTACECPLAPPELFVRSGPRYSFRRREKGAPLPPPPVPPRALPRPAVPRELPEFLPPAPVVRSPAPPANPEEKLARAAELADRGLLEPALRLCEEWLTTNRPNVRAYYLSGLILCALGRYEEAREPLRKAVYLDPSHREALLQSALCLERLGSLTAAALLRQRAKTVEG